tara:strand:- start:48309 stop:49445 length:1137 start_codon:yes stop_codon:yes gene_type:complete
MSDIDCQKFKHPVSIYSAIVLLKKNDVTKIDELVNKCERGLSELSQTLLNLAENENAAINTKWLSKNIKYINRIKAKKEIYDPMLRDLFKESLRVSDLKQGLEKESQMRKIYYKLEKSDSPFWKNFVELVVALQSNNKAWLRRSMMNIMNSGPEILLFDENHSLFKYNPEWEKDFSKMIKQMSDFFEDDPLRFKLFVSQLSNLFSSQFFKEQRNLYNVSWSLSDLREMSQKRFTSKIYFPWIFSSLYPRTSDQESHNFLESLFKDIKISDISFNQFWIFYYYLPKDQAKREAITKKLIQMWKSKKPYYQYLVLRLLEEQIIKDLVGKSEAYFKQPLFKIKRDYFTSLLNSGQMIDLSIYNLLSLGDLDMKKLLWMVIK